MLDEYILDPFKLEQNKDLVRRFLEECWNRGRLDRVEQLVAVDCTTHDPVFPQLHPGAENLKRHIAMCRNAFPDLRYNIEDMIAERDEVVVHWTARGTHEGTFLGMGPTHKSVQISGTSIFRMRQHKICEKFVDWNLLTLISQIGAPASVRMHVAGR
jgi:steroid delta-isomerase-like uncharacterized protein